ncbi:GNAT family N-acetyltransferase [Rhizobium halophilum]|uniref:GNAT family N-acetyltransferase n=1 Tax=Rhizobium halophilum TaxID=2846852 RepID=UPI001EFCCD87|nr:GNAT family N-acetyltransferase [Rhizobium halophilum]MCF6368642.1 GNAT family N-acetyltransferase [Rhizobium halophilum]
MSQPVYDVDVRRLEEFSAVELHAMLKLRVDVFVVEQNCPYAELDDHDVQALHLRLLQQGNVIGCARLWKPPEAPPRIGRVAISPGHRGQRLGEALMREAISACQDQFPHQPIAISAQSHLEGFYGSLGFEKVSDEYVEDGIPHVDMQKVGS